MSYFPRVTNFLSVVSLIAISSQPVFASYGIGGKNNLKSDNDQLELQLKQQINNTRTASRRISPNCNQENVSGGIIITCSNGGVTVSCIYPRSGGPAQCVRTDRVVD